MVHVELYVPTAAVAGMASRHVGVTVIAPVPVLVAALDIFVAVGAVAAAGSVYGTVIEFVGVTHDTPASQATDGAVVIVVELFDKLTEPLLNAVDVAVTFQPAPVPRASLMSSSCV